MEITRLPTFGFDGLQTRSTQPLLLPDFFYTGGSTHIQKALEQGISPDFFLEYMSNTTKLNDLNESNSFEIDRQQFRCNQDAFPFTITPPSNSSYGMIDPDEAGVTNIGAKIDHQEYTDSGHIKPDISQSLFSCFPPNSDHPWFSSLADQNPSQASLIGPSNDQLPSIGSDIAGPIGETATPASICGSRHFQRPLHTAIVEENDDKVAMKRARNTAAARHYRDRKTQRLQQLQKKINQLLEKVQELETDRNRWKAIAMARSSSQLVSGPQSRLCYAV